MGPHSLTVVYLDPLGYRYSSICFPMKILASPVVGRPPARPEAPQILVGLGFRT